MRFAENARYQTRLASSLRRRQEVMQGTVLVDVPFPDEPPLETIHDNLLIGDVETVAEKLVAEIQATKPGACVLFVQGRQHAAQGGDALDGADDRRGQAESREGAGPWLGLKSTEGSEHDPNDQAIGESSRGRGDWRRHPGLA